jgi:hypothetical protein
MAIAYTAQYQNEYISVPAVPVYSSLAMGKTYKKSFTFTNPTVVSISGVNDVLYLVKVPAICDIIMGECRFQYSDWVTNTLIDIGWLAYRNPNGTVVAANSAGLLLALDVDVAGWWFDGTTHSSTGTIVHNPPVAEVYSVRAQEEVTITATFRGFTPPQVAADVFNGYITFTV